MCSCFGSRHQATSFKLASSTVVGATMGKLGIRKRTKTTDMSKKGDGTYPDNQEPPKPIRHMPIPQKPTICEDPQEFCSFCVYFGKKVLPFPGDEYLKPKFLCNWHYFYYPDR